jgi:hypothetical protein
VPLFNYALAFALQLRKSTDNFSLGRLLAVCICHVLCTLVSPLPIIQPVSTVGHMSSYRLLYLSVDITKILYSIGQIIRLYASVSGKGAGILARDVTFTPQCGSEAR